MNNDELLLALAKFFANAWDEFTESGSLQSLMEDSEFTQEKTAELIDIENGDAPEGTEEGDLYYELNDLGRQVWKLAKEKR